MLTVRSIFSNNIKQVSIGLSYALCIAALFVFVQDNVRRLYVLFVV